jgi:hypothetical protein
MGIPTGYTVNIINIESRLSDEPLAAGEASGRRPRSLIIHLKRGEAQLVRLSACHLRETFDQFAHSGFSPSRLLYRTVPMTLGPRPSLKKNCRQVSHRKPRLPVLSYNYRKDEGLAVGTVCLQDQDRDFYDQGRASPRGV